MTLFKEIALSLIYAILIVLISKYILVKLLRKLSESLNLKPATVGNISRICNFNSRVAHSIIFSNCRTNRYKCV